jgi:hypothetical protein
MFSWVESANTECVGDGIILFTMLLTDKSIQLRMIIPKIKQLALSDTFDCQKRSFDPTCCLRFTIPPLNQSYPFKGLIKVIDDQ